MAFADLKTQMDAIVIRTEARLLAVTKQAIYDTAMESQKTRTDGGKMPVITGFLRRTGISSLNTPPSGPIRGDRDKTYTWSGDSVLKVLSGMKIGDIFYFGWSAIYARKQNTRHGFLDAALMNWQRNVDAAIAVFRKKDGK
jgi:hypothetical protein